MQITELLNYFKNINNDFFEYSFYSNSSDIMGAVIKNGLVSVLEINEMEETSKGIFKCKTNWIIDQNKKFEKNVNIDITNEIIFITELI